MAWSFWSKFMKKNSTDVPQVTVESLQEELSQLQENLAEVSRSRDEWQAMADKANSECDSLRNEWAQAIESERQQFASTIAELNAKHETLDAELRNEQQKLVLLDEANVKMAEMVRQRDDDLADREQKLEDSRIQLEHETKSRDAQIQNHAERIRELETQHSELSSQSSATIEELSGQFAVLKEESSNRIEQLERELATLTKQSQARIAELEQKLQESENRSAKRAEQRSALIRNLQEIHRLSAVSGKSESNNDALKILNPGWHQEASHSESESA